MTVTGLDEQPLVNELPMFGSPRNASSAIRQAPAWLEAVAELTDAWRTPARAAFSTLMNAYA